jgi:hypothetical protein
MFESKEHNIYLILFLLNLSSFFPTASYANTFGDIDIGIINDDNLTRSDYGPDKKSDTAIEVFVDYGKFYDLNNNWSATTTVFSQYSHHIDYNQLSTFGVGISGSARKKLGLGAYSSSILTSASVAINSVKDSKRNNNAVEFDVSWNKRLNDTWELATGVSLDYSNAKNSVFDTSGTTIHLSTDYTVNEKLLFSFGLSRRTGDIITVTNASKNPNEATYGYLSLSSGTNKINDNVYSSGLTAYRITADTFIIKISMSYALNDVSSLNAGYENQNSTLGYGISYKNNIFRVNYVYSF